MIGLDDIIEEKIAENFQYEPWFSPIFDPGELEILFFGIQAIIGVLLLVYFLWSSKKFRSTREKS